MAITTNTGGGVFAEINITPLTDIFLVLLIIFMVATSVTIESAAHVDLPKAQAAAPSDKPHNVVVSYSSDRQIMVNGKPTSEAQLGVVLHGLLDKSDDKIVVFSGEPKVILGDMVRILDIAKSAGAAQIAIAAQKNPGSGS